MRFKGIILSICLLLCACGGEPENTIRVGTISGPESELMQVAKQVAADKYNLNIKIVEFSDYITPNIALNDGSIDANVYQHGPFLKAAAKARGYNFTILGKTFIYPMALYSKKHKSLNDITHGVSIAIPNDPSNEARALLLLDKAGVIKLKPDSTVTATVEDIAFNPREVQFKPLDAAQLPRALDDVDFAIINTNYAFSANLLPKRDSLLIEANDSPYANLIVAKRTKTVSKNLANLVKALQSKPVVNKANQLFKGQAIIAW